MMAMVDSALAPAVRTVEAEEVEVVVEDDNEEEEEEDGEGEGGDEEVEEASSMSRKEENEKEKGVCVGSGRVGVKRPRGCTAKERISKMPPCAGKRSSIYRGVTRHRWTGRYEAHLWDKSTWNENQNKKGKQVYLGAYDEEEAAARAYDLAALKYWGPSGTQINFPVSDYSRDIEEMQNVSREEYLASLRRKSSGFSRGMSKFRCASRHYQSARWDAQMGRIWTGNSPQINNYGNLDEGGATPSLELSNRGGGCHTPINIACFLSWLQPGSSNSSYGNIMDTMTSTTGETAMYHHNRKRWSGATEEVQSPGTATEAEEEQQQRRQGASNHQAQSSLSPLSSPSSWQECCEPYRLPSLGLPTPKKSSASLSSSSSPSAYSLLFQSQMFKELLERVSSTPPPLPYPPHAQCQFNNGKTQNLTELHTSSTTTTSPPVLYPHPHPYRDLKLDPFKSETHYAQPSEPCPLPRPPLLPLQKLPTRITPSPFQHHHHHHQQQQKQQVLPWNDDNGFRPPLMSWMYASKA